MSLKTTTNWVLVPTTDTGRFTINAFIQAISPSLEMEKLFPKVELLGDYPEREADLAFVIRAPKMRETLLLIKDRLKDTEFRDLLALIDDALEGPVPTGEPKDKGAFELAIPPLDID